MEMMYLWPENTIASLFVLWAASVIFLWAARSAMLRLIQGLGGGLADGFTAIARTCARVADDLRERNRKVLLAAGTRDAQGRLDRELARVDAGFSAQLGQYGSLQRRLDDTLLALETDYQGCGVAPPDVPGWASAIKAIANIPMTGDPNIQKVLDGIRHSSAEAEKKALRAFREDSAKRHKILGSMLPAWKGIRGLLAKMQDSVSQALESSTRINAFVDDYEKVRRGEDETARALTFSAVKFFLVAAGVLAIAFGAAFINFQLIALPMSELVPAGARVGGFPVASISALVIVLMETVLGIFLMEMLGITDLFPKLQSIAPSRRKLVLGVSLAGLFFLASVESSLAVLREQIVEAETALKLSLAGEESRLVTRASDSLIPVVGQAVLGFVLPWVLALVAIPLEMLLDSARHVLGSLGVLLLEGVGHLASAGAQAARSLARIVTQLYDVYIAIPLRIEQAMRNHSGAGGEAPARTGKRPEPRSSTGEVAP